MVIILIGILTSIIKVLTIENTIQFTMIKNTIAGGMVQWKESRCMNQKPLKIMRNKK